MTRSSRPAAALLPLLIVSVAVLLPDAAKAFEVRYDYYVFAAQSDGIPIADDAILNGQTSVSGSFTKNGDPVVGNFGTVEFSADIATGTVSSYVHAEGARITNTPYTGAGRIEQIAFRDTLHCLVPAGTYPDGVSVALSGRVRGSLSATANANAQAQYFVDFGSDDLGPTPLQVGTAESATIPVNEFFTLTREFVVPGGTLPTEQTFSQIVQVFFDSNRASTTASVPGDYTASATVDLVLQLFSLEVPPNVTCDSDSGVFLSDPPPAVPALPFAGRIVLLLALLAFAAWVFGRGTPQHVR